MTETNITLSKLAVWNGNARKTNASEGLGELIASIAAHGLLQPLVVKKAKRGMFDIVAGQRRYLALMELAKQGTINGDYAVPCRLVEGETDLTEISLAENIIRVGMHPADQFVAFRELADKGMNASDIASRFGVTETLVMKRMKLGRVSPKLLDLYRQGELSLNHIEAFTVSDDWELQEHVWHDMNPYNRYPSSIRLALTEGEIAVGDRRVKLVTLEAYEAAGGQVRRDLFDAHNQGYVQDTALLESLVREKLEAAAAEVRVEGWKWVEIIPDFDYDQRVTFAQRRAQSAPLSQDEQAELDALQKEYDALGDEYDGEDVEVEQKLEALLDRINAIENGCLSFSEETLAIAGAIISIGHEGLTIDRGLVRAEDLPDGEKLSRRGSKKQKASGMVTLPAKVIEDLSAYKTAAIRAELMDQPDIALAAVVHAFVTRMVSPYGDRSCLEVVGNAKSLSKSVPETNKAMEAIAAAGQRWGDVLPGDGAALWDWCLDQSRSVLLDLLAYAVANTVNAVQGKVESHYGHGRAHAERLATALGMDMTKWFTPTAENYFSHASKPLIVKAVCEAKKRTPSPKWEKMKKAELAIMAEREVAATGWLPEQLRVVSSSAVFAEAAE